MANYRRGYLVERRAVEELEKEGYLAVRTAGSHSPFDVVAVGAGMVRLVQVKRSKKRPTPSLLRKAEAELAQVPEAPFLQREVWVWEDRKGFTLKEVI